MGKTAADTAPDLAIPSCLRNPEPAALKRALDRGP